MLRSSGVGLDASQSGALGHRFADVQSTRSVAALLSSDEPPTLKDVRLRVAPEALEVPTGARGAIWFVKGSWLAFGPGGAPLGERASSEEAQTAIDVAIAMAEDEPAPATMRAAL